MTYRPIATVGGVGEENELFQFGRPQPWLADSTTIAYSDEVAPGRLVVADILTGEGWSIDHPRGADGPGQIGGSTPWISTTGDTIKLLTSIGRLSARSVHDGVLYYDSLLAGHTPGQMWAGIARNARVTIHVPLEMGGEIKLRLESPSRYHAIAIGGVESAAQLQNPGVSAAARGNLIAYQMDGVIHTRSGDGLPIASRRLPWELFFLTIDGSERLWVQVFGHNPDGYNLVVLYRETKVCSRSSPTSGSPESMES